MSLGRRRRAGFTLGGSSLYRDLRAYYKLDEASGTRVDATGRGNNLTDNNTVTQNPGKIGNAGQFTRANSEYLSLADTADVRLTGAGSWMGVAWIYRDAINVLHRVLGKEAGPIYEYGVYISTNNISLEVRNAANNGFYTATNLTTLNASTWYMIAFGYDASAAVVQISVNNGAFTTSAAADSGRVDTAPFELGRTDGGQYFDGRIDAVGIWKRLLTAVELTLLYNNGNGFQLF